MEFLRASAVTEFAQGRDIVKDPERSSMSGKHEVVIFYGEIVNWNRGQVQLQRTPVSAIIKRHEHAHLSSGIDQTALLGVFAHRADESIIGNSFGDFCPGLSVVAGFVDVRVQIVILMAVHCYICSSSILRRRLDEADTTPVRHLFRGDIYPSLPAITRDMNQTIIGTGPNESFCNG